MLSDIRWGLSRYGNRILVIDGWRYRRVTSAGTNGRENWRCIKSDNGCRAFAVTIWSQIVRVHDNHEHDRLPKRIQIKHHLPSEPILLPSMPFLTCPVTTSNTKSDFMNSIYLAASKAHDSSEMYIVDDKSRFIHDHDYDIVSAQNVSQNVDVISENDVNTESVVKDVFEVYQNDEGLVSLIKVERE